MIFKHEYTDLDTYVIRGDDGRIYSPDDEGYQSFIKSNTPGKISGDRFVSIVNGQVVIDPNKEIILLQEAKTQKKIVAKAVARQRIIAIANEDKQRNYIARFSELLEKKINGIALTQAEIDEMASLREIWDRIKAIRASSNAIEAEIEALATVDEVNMYAIESNALWRE